MPLARPLGAVWDEAQPGVLRWLGRILLTVGLTLSAPFFALAIVGVLLERGLWWIVVPAALGVVVLLLAGAAWLLAWWMAREWRDKLRGVERLETAFEENVQRADRDILRGAR